MKKAITRTTLLILAVCLLGLLSVLIVNACVKSSARGRILSAEAASAAKEFDCILVLGCGVRPDGAPTNMLEDRLLQAVRLYEQGTAGKLLVSDDHGRADYDEVNVMKRFSVDRGIPPEDIFMDHAGFSTYESLYRALYVAQKLGLDAWGVGADLRPYSGQTYREMREIQRKW